MHWREGPWKRRRTGMSVLESFRLDNIFTHIVLQSSAFLMGLTRRADRHPWMTICVMQILCTCHLGHCMITSWTTLVATGMKEVVIQKLPDDITSLPSEQCSPMEQCIAGDDSGEENMVCLLGNT